MSNEVATEGEGVSLPNLDETIPSTGDDVWDGNRWTEANTGDPLAVSLSLGSKGELALSKRVPELDGLITRSGDDLTVVEGECDGKDVLLVTHETTCGLSGADLPETERSIPRSRECELSIGGDDHVGNEVVVSAEGTAGISCSVVLGLFGGTGLFGEVPYEDGLVTGGGEDEVWVFLGGGDGGYPVIVAGKGSAESK